MHLVPVTNKVWNSLQGTLALCSTWNSQVISFTATAYLDWKVPSYLLHSKSISGLNLSSRTSVAKSGCLSFLLSPTVLCTEDLFGHLLNVFLIDSITHLASLWSQTWVSFSKLNPCHHKWTVLVHLLVFWLGFSAGCAGKERHLRWNADDRQCPGCIGNSAAKLVSTVTSSVSHVCHVNIQCAPHMKCKEFLYGRILASRIAV